VDANAAATAAIVMGDRAPDWLGEHAPIARLVSECGTVRYLPRWPKSVAS
jgi:thiamine biosynthesis lipoprotein